MVGGEDRIGVTGNGHANSTSAGGGRHEAAPYLLLVENNDDDVFLTLRSLARNRFMLPVRVVQDGRKALEVLTEGGELPLAVLVSYRLPVMTGVDIIEKLRANDRTRHTPAILVTASENEREHVYDRRACERTVSACMVKPIGYDSLVHQLCTLDLLDDC